MPNHSTSIFLPAFDSLVRSLCRHPDKLVITESFGLVTVLELVPHEADYGILLGKKRMLPDGSNMRMLMALGIVAARMARREGKQVKVQLQRRPPKVLTEGGGDFTPNENWDKSKLERILLESVEELFNGKVKLQFEKVGSCSTRVIILLEKEELNQALKNALFLIANAIGSAEGQQIILEVTSE